MAATRLIALHANKGKTISQCIRDRTDYAKNGEKTEDGFYISTYECDQETVTEEFVAAKREYLRKTGRANGSDVIAYQIRQSFKPGEITPEEANKVGYETAMRFTKGKHMFIVATHTDKAHIHNHIIYNSTDLECGHKFRDFWFSGIALQRLSDIICLEHGLSIIERKKPSERAKWDKYPNRPQYRVEIREKIDQVLSQKPEDFEKFLKLLSELGYEMKRGAHIAVKGADQKRFIRLDSLGVGYTENDIRKTISGEMALPVNPDKKRKETVTDNTVVVTGKGKSHITDRELGLAVDIQEKLMQGKSGGYIAWAKKYNTKQFAETILFLQQHNISDLETLETLADEKSKKFHNLSKEIKDCESKIDDAKNLREQIFNYSKTKEVYVKYRKSGYSKKYYEAHRAEITIHKAAKEAFAKLQDGKIPKVKDLNAEISELVERKKKAYQEYKSVKKESQEYQIVRQNVKSFFEDDPIAVQEKMQKQRESLR